MYELKKGKVFTSKSVRTGPSSYEKRIYQAAVSQRLSNADVKHCYCCTVEVKCAPIANKHFHNPRARALSKLTIAAT